MADAISTLGSWTYGAQGNDVYGTIDFKSDGTVTINNFEGSFELNALYATNNDDEGTAKYKGSLNMNGVRNAKGQSVKWDSQVVIDSAGLRGADDPLAGIGLSQDTKEEQELLAQEHKTSYISGKDSYTLSTEQSESLFDFIESEEVLAGALADVQLGIRATSGGELQEDSYKLLTSEFAYAEREEANSLLA